MRLTHNESAEFALRQVYLSSREDPKAREQIASGKSINHAGDDAAGLSMAARFSARYRGLIQAGRNLQDAAALIDVAEGAYSTTTDMLQKMRQLAVQSSNDTLLDSDRDLLQKEVTQLTSEIDRQGATVQYNGKKIFQGNDAAGTKYNFHAGADANQVISADFTDVNAAALGVASVNVGTRDQAQAAIASIDTALTNIAGRRADLGSARNRIDRAVDFTSIARENAAAAGSRIEDTDFGVAVTAITRNDLLSQSRLAALAQANVSPESVLTLLGG